MTPKEKAECLVRNMEFQITYVYDPTESQADDTAKKCALISVDEIINTLDHLPITFGGKAYWKKVKKEIEKL